MTVARTPRHAWRWVRHASSRHEDAWRERLAFLGPGNLVVHGKPGTSMIRLEIYADKARPLERLAREFGGAVSRVDTVAVVAAANAPRKPLRIGRDLAIMDAHGSWPRDLPRPRILLRIGSAMAFGTGDHATTATCLRLLQNEAKEAGESWTALDIGTGSGILALAAEKLGASAVTAFDNDRRAVEAARVNARLSGSSRTRISTADVTRWKAGRRRHRIVMANLFSGLLVASAPSIRRALAPGGALILSGILRPQEKEVLAAFRKEGLVSERVVRRGKWVALLLRAAGA